MSRPRVTSDPDRGVAVNSGTDPQRPRTPAVPVPEPAPACASETSVPSDPFDATHEPKAPGGNQDVEGGGPSDPDDVL